MMVDLAGSERITIHNDATQSTKKLQQETIGINKSLMTLRKVIATLNKMQSEKSNYKQFHVPYRESKLTALLKQSMGGNSYCLMIACINPNDENYEENLSTLTYATKTGDIQNKPLGGRRYQSV